MIHTTRKLAKEDMKPSLASSKNPPVFIDILPLIIDNIEIDDECRQCTIKGNCQNSSHAEYSPKNSGNNCNELSAPVHDVKKFIFVLPLRKIEGTL